MAEFLKAKRQGADTQAVEMWFVCMTQNAVQ